VALYNPINIGPQSHYYHTNPLSEQSSSAPQLGHNRWHGCISIIRKPHLKHSTFFITIVLTMINTLFLLYDLCQTI